MGSVLENIRYISLGVLGRQRQCALCQRERCEPQLQPQRLPQSVQLQLWRSHPLIVSSHHTPVFTAGVSFLNNCNHFPSILPAVVNFWDNCPYLAASNPFASHKSVMKNFKLSSLRLNSSKKANLLSRLAYLAVNVISKSSVNKLSILTPMV